MTDRSDGIVITTRKNGAAFRRTFEPRSDGRYDVREQTLTIEGDWREVGHEVVDDVEVENGA